MKFEFEQVGDSFCPRIEIAEYLDGELSLREELDLDFHFAACKTCLEELNVQKKVSSSLEILLDEENEEIKLPENFTKIVATKAESNLDGLRSPKERSRGLFICAILFLLIAFSFGTKGDMLVLAVSKFSDQFFAIGGFIWHLFYTLSLGISTIFGSLFTNFVFGSTLTLMTIVVAFVLGSLLLSRMLFRFNRT